MKSKDINFQSIIPSIKHFVKKSSSRMAFVAIMAVLLAYLLVVWRISSLATADPPPDAETPTAAIPRIDKKAVDHILLLEASNTEVRSLFNEARNNPFQE